MTTDDTLAPAGGERVGAPIWSSATLPWRLIEIAAAGALAGVLIILTWLDPRPDLCAAAGRPFFWIRTAYPAAVAACALVSATRTARGRPGGVLALAPAVAVAGAMLIAAAIQASGMTPAGLWALYWPSAPVCLGDILLIAAPMLALTIVGLRDVDLERPAPTGLACGLFCGGVAAAVEGLHCWQSAYALVGPGLTLAMLVSGGLGAVAVKLLARRRRFSAE